jgi:hypothetical protein
MTGHHEREAEALARRLRAKNASNGKRAASVLPKSARASSKSRIRPGRATRGQGEFTKRNTVQALHYQKHRGSLDGDEYGQKKAVHSFTTMLSLHARERREEFLIEAVRHPQSDPTNVFVHFSLSLPPETKISHQMWETVVKEVLDEIGASGCSFAAHVHEDTANQHCHVVLSRSKPDGKLLSVSHDYWRFREAAAVVADCHLGGRAIERPIIKQPTPTSTAAETANRRAKRRGTNLSYIQPDDISSCLARSSNFNQFEEELTRRGIELKLSKRESGLIRGVLFKAKGSEEYLAGSSISRELTLPKIQSILNSNREKNGRDGYLHMRRIQQQSNAELARTKNPRERGG